MISVNVKVETYKDIKDFVQLASKYGDDLVIKNRTYEFPACSLMSVMSLVDLSETVKIKFDESIYKDVIADFSKWIIREN